MRIGKRMQAALDIVRRNPGLVMMAVAREVGPNGSLRYGYEIVWRAVDAGLIRAESGPRASRVLYAVDHA